MKTQRFKIQNIDANTYLKLAALLYTFFSHITHHLS